MCLLINLFMLVIITLVSTYAAFNPSTWVLSPLDPSFFLIVADVRFTCTGTELECRPVGWQLRGVHDDASLLDFLYTQLLRADEAGAAEAPPGTDAASEQVRAMLFFLVFLLNLFLNTSWLIRRTFDSQHA